MLKFPAEQGVQAGAPADTKHVRFNEFCTSLLTSSIMTAIHRCHRTFTWQNSLFLSVSLSVCVSVCLCVCVCESALSVSVCIFVPLFLFLCIRGTRLWHHNLKLQNNSCKILETSSRKIRTHSAFKVRGAIGYTHAQRNKLLHNSWEKKQKPEIGTQKCSNFYRKSSSKNPNRGNLHRPLSTT